MKFIKKINQIFFDIDVPRKNCTLFERLTEVCSTTPKPKL